MAIKGVIFDWAGTTVDYGCFAPVEVFVNVFREAGIDVTYDEAREPMGISKIDHIRAMLKMPRIQNEWKKYYGNEFMEEDVKRLYGSFERLLMDGLATYTKPIPYVVEAVEELKKAGIRIGSTTGYTREMIDVVQREAKKKGYAPDCIVTGEEVNGKGRPYPYMIFENMKQLDLASVKEVVKVGDTIADIKEGLHAGVYTVGVIVGSSEIGLSEEAFLALSEKEQEEKIAKTRQRFEEAGADFTIKTMAELPNVIESLKDS